MGESVGEGFEEVDDSDPLFVCSLPRDFQELEGGGGRRESPVFLFAVGEGFVALGEEALEVEGVLLE